MIDWRALPLITAATLAQGLPAHSRVMRAMSGQTLHEDTLLLAVIADRLGHLAWMLSEAGQKGRDHPPSILEKLTGAGGKPAPGYDTAEEFLAAWAAMAGGDENGD